MFGRVEGSKQVVGDSSIPLQPQDTVYREKFLFDYSATSVGDELSISATSTVTAKGTNDKKVLEQAPSPMVKVAGSVEIARIVVDLEKNYLYTYDENGKPKMVYLIASGKDKTPTDKGLRKIHHYEKYPYKDAPPTTVRHQKPAAFGPRVIYLEIIDEKTGSSLGSNGEFIHGNNDESSLGQYKSGGCMRMDNEVIKDLVDSGQIPAGSYVLIK